MTGNAQFSREENNTQSRHYVIRRDASVNAMCYSTIPAIVSYSKGTQET